MICMLADIWMSWQHLRSIGMLHSQNRLVDDGEGTLVVKRGHKIRTMHLTLGFIVITIKA